MFSNIPKNIESYVKNTDNVPLVDIKGTKWFLVTEDEFVALKKYLNEVDSVPEKIWRNLPKEQIDVGCICGNNADRIIRNCVIKDDSEQGYKTVTRSYLASLF